MARKRIKVKPSKGQSTLRLISGVILLGVGLFVIIPQFGSFGILWTLVVAFSVFVNFKNVFTEEGMPTKEIIIDDGTFAQLDEPNSIEERLKKVESLYQQGLITRDEYDQKRQELIDKL